MVRWKKKRSPLLSSFFALYLLFSNCRYSLFPSPPLGKKKNIAVWRGSTTGGMYTRENYKNKTRSKLVRLSIENPKLLDARFNQCTQCANDNVSALIENDGLGWADLFTLEQQYDYSMHVSFYFFLFYNVYVSYIRLRGGSSTSMVFTFVSCTDPWLKWLMKYFVGHAFT